LLELAVERSELMSASQLFLFQPPSTISKDHVYEGVSLDVKPEPTVEMEVFLHLHTLLLAAVTVKLNFLNESHYFVTVFQIYVVGLHLLIQTPSDSEKENISSQEVHF
jgi:hypothetical protein